MLMRCDNDHEIGCTTPPRSCPHPGCGAPLTRIREDGTRHPKQLEAAK